MQHLAVKKIQKIVHLAGRIEDDIRQRNLKPGDRYFDTAKIALMLRSDTMHVNRALQLMAKRKILERRPRVGTFINHIDSEVSVTKLQRIRILVFGDAGCQKSLFDSVIIAGLHDVLGNVRIQVDIVPLSHQGDFLHDLQDQSLREPGCEGYVLLHSSLSTQRWFAASSLPVVLWGHPMLSVKDLCYVDRDMSQVGRLMVKHVATCGCEQILALFLNNFHAGDYHVFDAMQCETHASDLPGTALKLRSVDEDVVRTVVRDFLEKSGRPKGKSARPAIITMVKSYGDAAVEVLESMGMDPHRDATIVVGSYYSPVDSSVPYATVQPLGGYSAQGDALGKLLAQVAKGVTPEPDHVLFPVTLVQGDKGK